MGFVLRAFAISAIVGCYKPAAERSCTFRCEAADVCPAGFGCNNGFCATGNDACGSDGGVIDTPAGDPIDSPPGTVCYGTLPVRICLPAVPALPRTLDGNISTSATPTMTDCPESGGEIHSINSGGVDIEVCVFSGNPVTIPSNATITGTRPAVIIGASSIVIGPSAALDVGSWLAIPRFGAGANPTDICPVVSVGGVGEGGAGGSFVGRGGAGGPDGLGPSGANPLTPPTFHGGCFGGNGSGLTTPGSGGGAVYLISDNQIAIQGVILAGGAGGAGGDVLQGGAGGGSGGYIGVEAPEILLGNAARLIASGGGGGEGGDAANAGLNGAFPTAGLPEAAGGQGGGGGGNGGNGGELLDGDPGNAGTSVMQPGGGGGGGGAGVIKFFGGTANCTSKCFPPAP